MLRIFPSQLNAILKTYDICLQVEQKLLTISGTPVFSRFHWLNLFCVFVCEVFTTIVCHVVLFLLVVLLSVLLRITSSIYYFGIFNLFLIDFFFILFWFSLALQFYKYKHTCMKRSQLGQADSCLLRQVTC